MKRYIDNSLLPYIKHNSHIEHDYGYCRKSFIYDALSEDSELVNSTQFLRLSILEESLVYIIKKTKNRDIDFLLDACKYIERTVNGKYFREENQNISKKKKNHNHISAHSGKWIQNIKKDKKSIIKELFTISYSKLSYSKWKKTFPFTDKAHKEIITLALSSINRNTSEISN